MSKLLTVIIPTYNRVEPLGKLLRQILAMNNSPKEIIVVNDNSTDTTMIMLEKLRVKYNQLKSVMNKGKYQRDAKKTGLHHATQEYIGFLDDDMLIDDEDFFIKLDEYLKIGQVTQAKVILENMGKINKKKEPFWGYLTTKPYPILELPPASYNAGLRIRPIYPMLESGNFWHRSLKKYFIDENLIIDGYGESHAITLKLFHNGIKHIFVPELVIRHPGSTSGGSNRFNKKGMLSGFTEFHRGYFYNMIYMHSRWLPYWVWLWLPFFGLKSIVALSINHEFRNWHSFAYHPMLASLGKHFIRRNYV